MKASLSFARRAVPWLALVAITIVVSVRDVKIQTPVPEPLEVPARTVPVPSTVSPEMQKLIGAPLSDNWNDVPQTVDEWKAIAARSAAGGRDLAALRQELGVQAEPLTLGGVKGFMVTPQAMPPKNRDRLLIHLHGGCYVLGGGAAGTREAMYMAAFGRFKVMSIDYRMPPAFPYPAALDDAVAAWKAALTMAQPKNMAVFGTSAGGALTLAVVLRAKQEGLPVPGAIAPGTPMSDLTKTGDSFHTNALLDNVLVASDGRCDAMAKLYANGHDLKDPMLSPVYGDMHGFPPAILTTGTRDLLLSNTVRVHRKLRRAGVEAALHVYEGQSHAHYLRDRTAPETKEVFEEIARFFDEHLGS
ncbi:MAG: alpha/beta hydrolase fold domain-containing protein [Luteitalea sp.]|nr:alpha/beta hydrolase fold domain-containing protein [Luteitalea sp.]